MVNWAFTAWSAALRAASTAAGLVGAPPPPRPPPRPPPCPAVSFRCANNSLLETCGAVGLRGRRAGHGPLRRRSHPGLIGDRLKDLLAFRQFAESERGFPARTTHPAVGDGQGRLLDLRLVRGHSDEHVPQGRGDEPES